MCVNLMQVYGIHRVYYSTDDGDICFQKVTQMIAEDSDTRHVSRGLAVMIIKWPSYVKVARLPLTKKQKNDLFHKLLPPPS